MSGDVVGAVLAGGHGRRIGADKTSLEIGGHTLVRRAVDALRLAGLDVALVLRHHQPVPLTAHTVAVVRDEVEDAGPLGALHALLRWSPTEWALVAPCDQPLLAPELLRGLLSQPKDETDAIVGQPNGLLEPLPCLYRRTCLPAIESALTRGERSLRDLLSTLRVPAVPALDLRRWDPSLVSYLNVNTQADLDRARAIAEPASISRRESGEPLGQRR
ncbi:MAG: molybdenum cofactor guanylyltransferase [Dehalococcoidia bacterium]